MKKILFIAMIFSALQVSFAQTKDFYDAAHIPEIRVTFKQKNWSSLLDSFKVAGSTMLMGDVTIDGQKLTNSGVRMKPGCWMAIW